MEAFLSAFNSNVTDASTRKFFVDRLALFKAMPSTTRASRADFRSDVEDLLGDAYAELNELLTDDLLDDITVEHFQGVGDAAAEPAAEEKQENGEEAPAAAENTTAPEAAGAAPTVLPSPHGDHIMSPMVSKFLDLSDLDSYNVFVGNISENITEEMLQDAFQDCGEVKMARIVRDPVTRASKHYGFIHFASEDSLSKCLTPAYASNKMVGGSLLSIRTANQKLDLYVGNLPSDLTKEQLEEEFRSPTVGVDYFDVFDLKKSTDGSSKCFGFLKFRNTARADHARKLLAQRAIQSRPLRVAWAETSDATSNRSHHLSGVDCPPEMSGKSTTNLYISNLPTDLTEARLRELAEGYGTIRNMHIMRDRASQQSIGIAFVDFVDAADASKALQGMRGMQVDGKTVNVDYANQSKPKRQPQMMPMGGGYPQGPNSWGGHAGGYNQPMGYGQQGPGGPMRGRMGDAAGRYNPYDRNATAGGNAYGQRGFGQTQQQSYGSGYGQTSTYGQQQGGYNQSQQSNYGQQSYGQSYGQSNYGQQQSGYGSQTSTYGAYGGAQQSSTGGFPQYQPQQQQQQQSTTQSVNEQWAAYYAQQRQQGNR